MELFRSGFGFDKGGILMECFAKVLGGHARMGHMHMGRTFLMKDI